MGMFSGNGGLRSSRLGDAANAVLAKIESHLADSQISYQEHLAFAVKASGKLAYASVASLVHAFVPALFPATAAKIVIELYKERLENHPNPRYQEMMHGEAPRGSSEVTAEVTSARAPSGVIGDRHAGVDGVAAWPLN